MNYFIFNIDERKTSILMGLVAKELDIKAFVTETQREGEALDTERRRSTLNDID